MTRWPLPLFAVVIALAVLGAGDSVAQDVHRCITADGGTIFTDRACGDIQAVERTPPPVRPGARSYVRDCARSPDDLLFGVRSALDAQDVNKLAAFYHWTGVGTDESVRLMNRLEALSKRPLVDVALVGFEDDSYGYGYGDSDYTMFGDTPHAGPDHSVPDRIRIEQMRNPESAAAVRTTFHLQKNLGCWWIRY